MADQIKDASGSVDPSKTKNPKDRFGAFVNSIEQSVLQFRRRNQQPVRKSVSESAGPSDGSVLHRHFEEYAWARSSVTWLMVATGVIILLVVTIWAGVIMSSARPQGMVVSKPSLQDVIRAEMGKAFVAKRDVLDHFVWSTLMIKNTIDKNGSQLVMLRGLVSPDIFSRFERSVERNLLTIRRNQITQSLIVDRIGNIVQSADGSRVSVYVRGTLNIAQEIGEKGPSFRKLPYRAKLVCELVIPSSSNHQHFFVVDLEERVGPKAADWDSEQELQ